MPLHDLRLIKPLRMKNGIRELEDGIRGREGEWDFKKLTSCDKYI